jgi:hypothetical protein
MPRRVVLLILLAACRPPPAAPPTETGDDVVPAPPQAPAIVLFLDSAGRAVPLACAAPGVGLYLDAGDCIELIGDDRLIGDLGNGRRTLGDESAWFCNKTSRRAFKVDESPGHAFGNGDPANDLIVWPAARAFDVAVWQHAADDDGDDPHGRDPFTRVLGTLRVDLDGDGVDDEVVSVTAPGVPHRVLGYLSGSPDEVVTLLSDSNAELQAYAAVDLDGDGRPEIVVAAPYADGDWTSIEHYHPATQTLEPITGIGCGP